MSRRPATQREIDDIAVEKIRQQQRESGMNRKEYEEEAERLEALKIACPPRQRRLCAQAEGDYMKALYWLAQELAVEHRAEIRSQHRTSVVLDVTMIILVLIEVVRIFHHS
jgi:hypothetical protein